jgi:hypothetical protein
MSSREVKRNIRIVSGIVFTFNGVETMCASKQAGQGQGRVPMIRSNPPGCCVCRAVRAAHSPHHSCWQGVATDPSAAFLRQLSISVGIKSASPEKERGGVGGLEQQHCIRHVYMPCCVWHVLLWGRKTTCIHPMRLISACYRGERPRLTQSAVSLPSVRTQESKGAGW